jgi:hypothetical protein
VVALYAVEDISLCDDVGCQPCLAVLEALEGLELLVYVGVVEDPLILVIKVSIIQFSELLTGSIQGSDKFVID